MQVVNPHLKRPMDGLLIVATLVTDQNDRIRCLPDIAGIRSTLLESAIHERLRIRFDQHISDHWDYFSLSNGGFYMAPQSDAPFSLTFDGEFQHEVSANTAGLIACATAYQALAFVKGGGCFAKAYYQLSDFIFQHHDAGLIRAALND